jgi:hypothetical protein
MNRPFQRFLKTDQLPQLGLAVIWIQANRMSSEPPRSHPSRSFCLGIRKSHLPGLLSLGFRVLIEREDPSPDLFIIFEQSQPESTTQIQRARLNFISVSRHLVTSFYFIYQIDGSQSDPFIRQSSI